MFLIGVLGVTPVNVTTAEGETIPLPWQIAVARWLMTTGRTLFITSGHSVYRIELNTEGAR